MSYNVKLRHVMDEVRSLEKYGFCMFDQCREFTAPDGTDYDTRKYDLDGLFKLVCYLKTTWIDSPDYRTVCKQNERNLP